MNGTTRRPTDHGTLGAQRAAEQLDADNPQWMVMFGSYTREFVAFPLFPVPPGTIVAAGSEHDLRERMLAVESAWKRRQ